MCGYLKPRICTWTMEARGETHVAVPLLGVASDIPELAGSVTTTENLATLVRAALAGGWTLPARLAKVRISETARNTFELEVS